MQARRLSLNLAFGKGKMHLAFIVQHKLI